MSAPSATVRGVRIVHAALAGGLALIALVFAGLRDALGGPLGTVMLPDWAFAAIAFLQLAIAFVFLRRRVPPRRYDQSIDAYWSSDEPRNAAMVLWAVLEGGSLFSMVGYLLTGGIAPAVVALLGLVALVSVRPSRLEDSNA